MCPGLPQDPSLVPILPGPTPLLHPALCRFSGVTEADLEDTSITLRDVQAVLLSMFSADTILIGHSLESDLLALKVASPAVAEDGGPYPLGLSAPTCLPVGHPRHSGGHICAIPTPPGPAL